MRSENSVAVFLVTICYTYVTNIFYVIGVHHILFTGNACIFLPIREPIRNVHIYLIIFSYCCELPNNYIL